METRDENETAISLFVNNVCFVKKVLERIEEDVDRFWNGSAHGLCCLKACQISKVHARSHKILSHVRVQSTKTPSLTSRIAVSRTSKMRQTTCNWINRIVNEAT